MKRNWIGPSLRQKFRGLRFAWNALVTELAAEARRGSELRLASAGRSGLRLNIGCGPKVIDGWLNLDAFERGPSILWYSAPNQLPMDPGSVARIHCEHFLEHLDWEQAIIFLTECRRVLEPGGSMRVIVPDVAKYMIAYAARDALFFGKLTYLGNAAEPLETPAIICNQMFRMGGSHHFAWDFETLKIVCQRVGFSTVEHSQWKGGAAEHQIDGLEDWRPLESLYCEITV